MMHLPGPQDKSLYIVWHPQVPDYVKIGMQTGTARLRQHYNSAGMVPIAIKITADAKIREAEMKEFLKPHRVSPTGTERFWNNALVNSYLKDRYAGCFDEDIVFDPFITQTPSPQDVEMWTRRDVLCEYLLRTLYAAGCWEGREFHGYVSDPVTVYPWVRFMLIAEGNPVYAGDYVWNNLTDKGNAPKERLFHNMCSAKRDLQDRGLLIEDSIPWRGSLRKHLWLLTPLGQETAKFLNKEAGRARDSAAMEVVMSYTTQKPLHMSAKTKSYTQRGFLFNPDAPD